MTRLGLLLLGVGIVLAVCGVLLAPFPGYLIPPPYPERHSGHSLLLLVPVIWSLPGVLLAEIGAAMFVFGRRASAL